MGRIVAAILISLTLVSMFISIIKIRPAEFSETMYITSDYTFVHYIDKSLVVPARAHNDLLLNSNNDVLQRKRSGNEIERRRTTSRKGIILTPIIF